MLTAMVVDGSGAVRTVLGSILGACDPSLSVVEVRDARECLKLIGVHSPDIVFLSISLPGGSGLQLTRMIKAAHPLVRICLISLMDLPEYRSAAREAGAHFFLSGDSLSTASILLVVQSVLSARKKQVVHPLG